MEKKRIFCVLLIVLFVTTLFVPAEGKAQDSAYEKIEQIIHEKSWYEGCPICSDLFGTAFQEIEKGSPKWEKLVEYYSGCLMEEHREIEAINLLREALKASPRNHHFLSQIGTAYMRMQDDEKAEEYFLQSNAIEPNHDACYKLAFIHYKKGAKVSSPDKRKRRDVLLTKAEGEIKKTIALYEARAHISAYAPTANLSLLAHIYSAQGKTEEAIDLYREIIDITQKARNLNPKRRLFALTEFKFSLGQLLFRNGKENEGIKLMNEAVESAPTENLKRVKKMLLDLMLHPPKTEDELKARYPQIKEGTFIPLY